MALTEVSAFKNLSIINDDINSSAAIDGSKISPDFGSQNIVTTGQFQATGSGTSSGLKISNAHDSAYQFFVNNNNNSDFYISYGGSGGPEIKLEHDGKVSLSHAGTTRIQTTSVGALITGNLGITGTVDGVHIAERDTLFGGLTSSSGVLTNGVTATTQSASDNSTKIATTAYVDNASGGGSASSLTSPDGTTKVEAKNTEIDINDDIYLKDANPGIYFKTADGSTNLGSIVHYGSSNTFEIHQRVSGEDFRFKTQSGTSAITKILFRPSSGSMSDVCIGRAMTSNTGKPTDLNAFFPATGGVELYHIASGTGTKKFETTANGITVQGSVTTEDINMSNLNASANEVDNTKGSWTIQEGASDLFLINRVNGKKYKFNLTEIS